ncbi:MAG: hypothetical protein QGI78_02090 [Phycisphaerales bacterium]|jgi:hypothetical protein|nr:hypothetical protein [Phycisphaerales bacterium]
MTTPHLHYKRILGWCISVLLLGAAIFAIWKRAPDLETAIAAIEHPEPIPLSVLPILLFVSILAVSESFRQLLNRPTILGEGNTPIKQPEMAWLISVAGMLNWLPLRAGLIGRTVYHSKVHGIQATKSLRVLLESVCIIVGVSLLAILVSFVRGATFIHPLVAMSVPLFVAALFFFNRGAKPWAIAIACRYIDVTLLAARYFIIFRLLDNGISPETAILLAGASSIASLLPLPTGGLGGREWIIGLLSSWVTVLPAALAIGLIADLINRVVELIVVIPLGLLGHRYLKNKNHPR